MQIQKVKKTKDKNKLNIGVELEFYTVYKDTKLPVSSDDVQKVYKIFVKDFGWQLELTQDKKEIIKVTKEIDGQLCYIEPETTVSIFEATTYSPVSNLEIQEKIHQEVITTLTKALSEVNAIIWPKAVAPAFSGMYNLPKVASQYSSLPIYQSIARLEDLQRYAHTVANQVNIDCNFDQIIPAINSLYKNLHHYIEKFANGEAKFNNKHFRRGRDYWLLFYKSNPVATYGLLPEFPEEPFKNLQDFFERLFKEPFLFIERDGEVCTFEDLSTTPDRYFKEKQAVVVDRHGKKYKVNLEPADISIILACSWLDFKPHFDLDNFTVEEFIEAYNAGQLDKFLKKHAKNWWLEIRCCDAKFEDNAMEVPKYFYSLFANLEEFINQSKKIDWQEARQKWEKSLVL